MLLSTHSVRVADEAEKRRKIRKTNLEVIQQEAAADTPSITAAVAGVALSVCVSCCPHVTHSRPPTCCLLVDTQHCLVKQEHLPICFVTATCLPWL